jgi:hypothetical protein
MMRGLVARGTNEEKKPLEHLKNRHFGRRRRLACKVRHFLVPPQSQTRQTMSDDVTIQISEPKITKTRAVALASDKPNQGKTTGKSLPLPRIELTVPDRVH